MEKSKLLVLQDKALSYLQETNLSGYQISCKTGISESAIGNYKRGETKPKNSNAKILIDFFEKINAINREDEILIDKNFEIDKIYAINQKGIGVPYYDVDFKSGFDIVENDQTLLPAHFINFPHYSKADCWVNVTGHSMEPLINHGDIIAIRKLEDWNTYILPGEIYAIVTDEYRTIKYVRVSEKGDEYLRLVPENKNYDEKNIPKKIVRSVYQLLGCAKKIF